MLYIIKIFDTNSNIRRVKIDFEKKSVKRDGLAHHYYRVKALYKIITKGLLLKNIKILKVYT